MSRACGHSWPLSDEYDYGRETCGETAAVLVEDPGSGEDLPLCAHCADLWKEHHWPLNNVRQIEETK